MDYISDLPENVIEMILTLLPIRDAVRTCMLSRKWRYRWTTLSTLVFDDPDAITYDDIKLERESLINFISRTLFLHQGPIHKVQLRTALLDFYPDIQHWVLFLSRGDLKELVVGLEGIPGLQGWELFTVPSCLYNCKNLTHLDLSQCELDPPPAFKGFLWLKSLSLHRFWVSPEAIENFISSCPLLENLVLSRPEGCLVLNVRAPNLKYLWLVGDFRDIFLENTPLLVDVSVSMDMINDVDENFEQSSSCNFVKIFGGVPHLERLFGHGKFTKGLADAVDGREAPDLDFWEERCPKDWNFKHLKVGEMTDMTGVRHEMEFIKFLLANSPVLEMMCISPVKNGRSKTNGRLKMLIELLRFRRASAQAEIFFEEE